ERLIHQTNLGTSDHQLAAFLRSKGCISDDNLDLERINYYKEGEGRMEYANALNGRDAQNYLNIFYPLEIRSRIKILDIGDKGFTGFFDLSGFSVLEKVFAGGNKLTGIKTDDLTQ
ncbi:4024_t:CDS:1, partial [Racocetra persica]